MYQIHSALEKKARLYVRKASFIDDEMDEFGHTPKERDTFAACLRRKCSKLLTVPCAFLLIRRQNCRRLNNVLN
jgi:hypothetical protein